MIPNPYDSITTTIYLQDVEIQEDGYLVHFSFDYKQINHKLIIFMTEMSLNTLQKEINNITSRINRYTFSRILEENYKQFSTIRKKDQYAKNLLSLKFFLSSLSHYADSIRMIHDPSLLDLDLSKAEKSINNQTKNLPTSLYPLKLIQDHIENSPEYLTDLINLDDFYAVMAQAGQTNHWIILNVSQGQICPGIYHLDRFEITEP